MLSAAGEFNPRVALDVVGRPSSARELGYIRTASSPGFDVLARGNERAAHGWTGAEDDNKPHLCGDEDEKVKSGVCDRELEAAGILESRTYK